MSAHPSHTMHEHSLAAFDATELGKREALVLSAFLLAAAPMTDRECATALGFAHKSAVQPRISTLIDRGLLTEISSAKDPITMKTVRVCWPTSLARVLKATP